MERHRLGWAGLACLVAATALLALTTLPHSTPATLEASCIPCTGGPDCNAGCRSGAGLAEKPARMQQLSLVGNQSPARRRALRARSHQSLREQDEAMKRINKRLLRLSTHEEDNKGELGGVLNAAMDQMLRAEEAEVQLRRLAALRKEASIGSAVNHLGHSDKQLFKLRATEFELALKQADKEMAEAAKTMAPLADMDEVRRRGRSAPTGPSDAKPSWTSQMSNFLSSVVSDGHGKAWGYGNSAATKKAVAHKLPGVNQDNWSLNKGALALKPAATDDPKLPGVKTHGW